MEISYVQKLLHNNLKKTFYLKYRVSGFRLFYFSILALFVFSAMLLWYSPLFVFQVPIWFQASVRGPVKFWLMTRGRWYVQKDPLPHISQSVYYRSGDQLRGGKVAWGLLEEVTLVRTEKELNEYFVELKNTWRWLYRYCSWLQWLCRRKVRLQPGLRGDKRAL